LKLTTEALTYTWHTFQQYRHIGIHIVVQEQEYKIIA
jgi:hypothetical protein